MKFNELEIRIMDWARRNICSAFPDKSFQRVVAEAGVIVATRRIEAQILIQSSATGKAVVA